MFGSLSFNEIFFIMVLALLIFGPKRLPQIGRTIGRALGEFRRASSEFKRSVEVEMSLDEERRTEQETRQAAPRLEAAHDAVSRGGADETGEGAPARDEPVVDDAADADADTAGDDS